MGTRITFTRPDGKTNEGYLAKSPKAGSPGVVMIQEWWGLNEQIKGLADRLAEAGYDVLAPDLYSGAVVPYHDTDLANKEMTSLDFLDAVDQTARGAAQYLLKSSKKVGMTGYCMGGAMTVLGAARAPELSCGVIFYGLPPAAGAGPADVKIPIQGHFATKDDWCTPAAVETFENGLKEAGKTYEFYSYDADHAFVNEQRAAVHDRAAAELAWGRALGWFAKYLG